MRSRSSLLAVENQDGYVRSGPDLPGDLLTGNIGQAQIEHDQVERDFGRRS